MSAWLMQVSSASNISGSAVGCVVSNSYNGALRTHVRGVLVLDVVAEDRNASARGGEHLMRQRAHGHSVEWSGSMHLHLHLGAATIHSPAEPARHTAP
jgi:hypothetical protein